MVLPAYDWVSESETSKRIPVDLFAPTFECDYMKQLGMKQLG
jgi:hypothetical protein